MTQHRQWDNELKPFPKEKKKSKQPPNQPFVYSIMNCVLHKNDLEFRNEKTEGKI